MQCSSDGSKTIFVSSFFYRCQDEEIVKKEPLVVPKSNKPDGRVTNQLLFIQRTLIEKLFEHPCAKPFPELDIKPRLSF